MKVIIAGDFVPKYRLESLMQEQQYDKVFGEIQSVVSSADYAIVNFESPVVKEGFKPIEKCGPNLKCTQHAVEAVKWAGFKAVTLANNHILDYGDKGILETIRCCKEKSLDTIGAGNNIMEASQILFKKIGNKTLSIINCCEHEFSIATETSSGANPLNPIQQYYSIQRAKNNSDFVFVIVHGGHEHFQLPSPRMQETYRFFIDAGADAVVNHHQHCYSGYEVYKGKPIFYGLGNLCFDEKKIKKLSPWNFGYMVCLSFGDNQEISYDLIPYQQCADTPSVVLLERTAFDKKIDQLNSIIANKDLLREKAEEYYKKSSFSYGHNLLEPIGNPYFIGLVRRKFLPSLIRKNRRLIAQNYVCCESHRDKLSYYFSHPS